MPTVFDEVLAAQDHTTLKNTSQKRVAEQISDVVEVLAGHTNPRGPGPLQTINEVPFLFDHRTLGQ